MKPPLQHSQLSTVALWCRQMYIRLTVFTSCKYTSVYWPFSLNRKGTWPRFFVTDAWIVQALHVKLGSSSSILVIWSDLWVWWIRTLVAFSPTELSICPWGMVIDLLRLCGVEPEAITHRERTLTSPVLSLFPPKRSSPSHFKTAEWVWDIGHNWSVRK